MLLSFHACGLGRMTSDGRSMCRLCLAQKTYPKTSHAFSDVGWPLDAAFCRAIDDQLCHFSYMAHIKSL